MPACRRVVREFVGEWQTAVGRKAAGGKGEIAGGVEKVKKKGRGECWQSGRKCENKNTKKKNKNKNKNKNNERVTPYW